MITFIDKKPGFRRVYKLHDDSLVIEGKKWLGASFKQEFSLKKVKLLPDEHELKDDTKSALVGMPGLLIFMVGVFGGATIYEKTPIGFYSILGVGLFAMAVGFVFGGRMRVLVYKSHEEVPLFDVSGRGCTRTELDSFVRELQEHIRVANTSK